MVALSSDAFGPRIADSASVRGGPGHCRVFAQDDLYQLQLPGVANRAAFRRAPVANYKQVDVRRDARRDVEYAICAVPVNDYITRKVPDHEVVRDVEIASGGIVLAWDRSM